MEWQVHRTQEQVGRIGGPEIHVVQNKWTALKEMPQVEEFSLPECYSEVKLAFGMLSIFRLTYLCEQAFSCMNTIKNKVRSQLKNKNA